MKTRRLSAARALVEFLKVQSIERDGAQHRLIQGVFGIFGHGNVAGLGQALEEAGGAELPFYQPKNEQAAVHAAAAFAKAKRRLGAMACTSSVGPGATNMVTGAAGATINRVPVLLLPGDIFAGRLPAPVLQQLEAPQSMDASVNDCFKPVSKYWDRINRPEQLLAALPEAMRVLADPAETGAVTLCLPEDVQAEAYDFPEAFFAKRTYRVPRPGLDREAVKAAVERLAKAERPFIIAGGGVRYSEAEEALKAFVEQTRIPVGVTQAGKGALPDEHLLCMGAVGATGTLAANRLAREADLILCLGTRLSDFTTASKTQFQDEGVSFISLNINAFDAHKHGALPLVGDLRQGLEELGRALLGSRSRTAYAASAAAARRDWELELREAVRPKNAVLLSQAEVIGVLNDFAGADSTIVHAAGGLPGDLHKLWRSRGSEDYHSEYGYSCMGYEIAGALGVKLARPEREVYAVLGDGSYLMLSQELLTAVQEGLKITVLLLDNGGYQCIHKLQKACGGESFGNEFRRRESGTGRLTGETLTVDYAANAASLGAKTFEARDRDGLRKVLQRAKEEEGGPVLIVVPVDPGPSVPGWSWWDVPMSAASDNERTRKARQDYEKAAAGRRFYYR